MVNKSVIGIVVALLGACAAPTSEVEDDKGLGDVGDGVCNGLDQVGFDCSTDFSNCEWIIFDSTFEEELRAGRCEADDVEPMLGQWLYSVGEMECSINVARNSDAWYARSRKEDALVEISCPSEGFAVSGLLEGGKSGELETEQGATYAVYLKMSEDGMLEYDIFPENGDRSASPYSARGLAARSGQ